jgi:hypothetical protein
MAGHSRSKNGVAPLAYVPAIHVFVLALKTWMPGTRPGMTIRSKGIKSEFATAHASPEVSNIAESIASRADLPAQTTN